MSGSQREDSLLRQIRAVAAMLARIAGLRIAGQMEEAKAELERAYTMLLGSQTDLVRRVDSSTAAKLLGSSDRIQALAQLLDEEAALEGDEIRAARLRVRAAPDAPVAGSAGTSHATIIDVWVSRATVSVPGMLALGGSYGEVAVTGALLFVHVALAGPAT